MDKTEWDKRHADPARRHSRGPSETLVAAVSVLVPGRALDLACGQGRHAVWLAEHGWQVTAVDFSAVALGNARQLARERSVSCRWVAADLLEFEPEPEAFDLVILSYVHVPRSDRRKILAAASRALARGGTLLLIGLDRSNLEHGHGGPTNPAVLYDGEEIIDELPALRIETVARIERPVATPDGDRVAIDTLVRASRPM